MRKLHSKLSAYISDQVSGYPKQALYYINIICYDIKIYVQKSLRRCVIDWYHFYLNHLDGIRITKSIRKVCYWKVLVNETDMYANLYEICQNFKRERLFTYVYHIRIHQN